LGNLVLARVDAAIEKLCQSENVRYSRWVDDLTISGDRARFLIRNVIAAVHSEGFKINRDKLCAAGPGSVHFATGLTVNGPKPSVPRVVRDRLRAMAHNLTTGKMSPSEHDKLRRTLDGLAAYIAPINPNAIRRVADSRPGVA
jgi:RNA-directed DNA polymerase